MKNILTTIMMIFVLAFVAGTVSAADGFEVTSAHSDTDLIEFNGQQAIFFNEIREGRDFGREFEMELKFNVKALTGDLNISITTEMNENLQADGEDSFFDISEFNVTNESSKTITFTAELPEFEDDNDEYYGVKSGEGKYSLGKIKIQNLSNNQVEEYHIVYENENLLKLENEELVITYNDRKRGFDEGDEIDGIRPGDSFKIQAYVENLMDDGVRDSDIEDIDLRIEEGDLDVEDRRESISTIGGEDTEMVEFKINIPEDIEEGDYSIFLEPAYGETELDGEEHYLDWGQDEGDDFEIEVVVERPEHMLEIKESYLRDSKISCDESRNLDLTVSIQNSGSREEDDAEIVVSNSELGISEAVTDLEIPSIEEEKWGSEYQHTFNLEVPEDAEAGTYYLTVETKFSNGRITSQREEIKLVVEECQEETEEETQQENDSNEIVPDPVEQEPTTQEPTQEEQEDDTQETVEEDTMSQSPFYTSLLVLANIGLLVVIVGLGMKLFRKD